MTNPYRDQSLRELLGELTREVAELEDGFSPFFWARVARDVGLGGRSTRPLPGPQAPRAELEAARRALDERLGELRAILTRLPELEAAWLEPPDNVALVDAPSGALGRLWALLSISFSIADEKRALAAIRSSLRQARLLSRDLPHRRAVIEAEGLRFVLRWVRDESALGDTWGLTAVIAVARAAGSFTVRSRSAFEVIAAEPMLRTTDEFDQSFRVAGDAEAARFVLVKPLTEAMLELTESARLPVLELAPPAARLSWSGVLELALALDPALAVLRALRDSLGHLELRAAR